MSSYDEYYNSVSLALHMDGTNGSTSFIDSSPSPKIVTAFGNAQVSTAESKFGGASLYLDGNGDYLSIASSSDFAFGTSDFTIETFIRSDPQTTGRFGIFSTQRQSTSAPFGLVFGLRMVASAPVLEVFYRWNSYGHYGSIPATVFDGSFQHAVLQRKSGVMELFFAGVKLSLTTEGSGITSGVSFTDTVAVVGRSFATNSLEYFKGHIDEMRITKGVARYTANFTPPTAAFSDRGPRVSGVVRDSTGAPVSMRTVRAYRRDTGALLGDAMTGDGIAAPYDPHWDNVVSILHFDGAGGSTTFTDQKGKIWTGFGTSLPSISTDFSKFGGSSLLVNSANGVTSSGVDSPWHSDFDFGVGDFTIEWWQRWRSLSSPAYQAAFDHAYNHTAGITLVTGNADGKYALVVGGALVCTEASSAPAGEFIHYAVTREGSTFKIWRGGELSASGTKTSVVGATGRKFALGCYASDSGALGQVFNGWMDEWRITRGVARYTSAFVPPTSALPGAYTPPTPLGAYTIDTGSYTGDVQLIALAPDNTRNSQILDWVTPT